MRHRYPAATMLVVLLLTLGAGVAQAAPRSETHGGPPPGNPAASALPRDVTTAPPDVRLVPRVVAVQGMLRDFYGNPVSGAEVDWGTMSGGAQTFGGYDTTDAAGAYSFASVTPSTSGYLACWYKAGDEWRSLWQDGLTFTDPGTLTFDFRPGRVGWSTTRGGPWSEWQWPTVVMEDKGSNGAYTDYTVSKSATAGTAEAMPGSVDYACMYYWWDEADEVFSSPEIAVTGGAQATSGIAFDQNDALRTSIRAPYWWSCRPGDLVTMNLRNWPAGYQAAFRGYPEAPSGPTTTFGGATWTSAGTAAVKKFRIPRTAKAGYGYIIGTARTDDPASDLLLREYVQLATLKKTAVSGGVRLSGVVPTKGHWGSKAGIRKTVVIYAKTRRADTPKRWDPTGLGWRKVATLRCSGYGKYSKRFSPTRDTWYVARYAGDSWYWGAFTNVVSVAR